MHLVFATSIVPDGAPTTGYEIANAAILAGLRRAGVRVSVVGFAWPESAAADLGDAVVLGRLDVRNETADPATKLRWLAAALAGRLPVSCAKLRALPAAALRDALAGLEPYDGYVLNGVHMAGAFGPLFADRPALYVAHNVEHRSAAENAAAASSPLERLLFRREARLLAALERRLCREAGFVFTLSEDDRETLGLDESRAATLPLVTRETAPGRGAPRRTQFDAALIGTWTWQPNRIGLEWFFDAVVPLLDPGFTVAVAGRVPTGLRAPAPNVRLVGRVEDAAAFVRLGRVVPLVSRAGTGVQLKTIETFEQGLPSVATTRSVRGIARVPGNCTVTDDPAAFARALQAAAAAPHDVDGAAFHRAQRQALDAAMAAGLRRLGFAAAPGRAA